MIGGPLSTALDGIPIRRNQRIPIGDGMLIRRGAAHELIAHPCTNVRRLLGVAEPALAGWSRYTVGERELARDRRRHPRRRRLIVADEAALAIAVPSLRLDHDTYERMVYGTRVVGERLVDAIVVAAQVGAEEGAW